MNRLFAVVTIALALALSAFGADQNEISGKNLPPYVKASLKQLEKNLPTEVVSADQVVVIKNMDIFFAQHQVTEQRDQDVLRERQAFVLGNQFPLYINADHSSYKLAESVYNQNESVVTALAAAIRHEGSHARGNPDEIIAYGLEIDYLQAQKHKGHFNVPGADQFIANLQQIKDRIAAGTEQNGTIAVKIAMSTPADSR